MYEGWGQLAKQLHNNGSRRVLTLSLLLESQGNHRSPFTESILRSMPTQNSLFRLSTSSRELLHFKRWATHARALVLSLMCALPLTVGCTTSAAWSAANFNVSPEGFPLWKWRTLNPANPVLSVQKLYMPPPDMSMAAVERSDDGYQYDSAEYISGYFEGIDRFHDQWVPQMRRVTQPGPDVYTLSVKVERVRVGRHTYTRTDHGTTISTTEHETFTYSDVIVSLLDPNGVEVESFTRREVTNQAFEIGEEIRSNGRGVGIAVEHYLKARVKGRTEAGP